jgi:hypothetical protein
MYSFVYSGSIAAVGALVKIARILLVMCTRREAEIYNCSFYVFINVQAVKTRTPGRNKSGWPDSRSVKKGQRIRTGETECGGRTVVLLPDANNVTSHRYRTDFEKMTVLS